MSPVLRSDRARAPEPAAGRVSVLLKLVMWMTSEWWWRSDGNTCPGRLMDTTVVLLLTAVGAMAHTGAARSRRDSRP